MADELSTSDEPSFDELVDLLRVRLGLADDLNASESHSFKTLMKHEADKGLIAVHFYRRAFDELQAQGHLDPGASGKTSAFEAYGRISADGRLYLTSESQVGTAPSRGEPSTLRERPRTVLGGRCIRQQG